MNMSSGKLLDEQVVYLPRVDEVYKNMRSCLDAVFYGAPQGKNGCWLFFPAERRVRFTWKFFCLLRGLHLPENDQTLWNIFYFPPDLTLGLVL